MLLKSLELQGYKTFAGKSNFVFADQITAIVGPNGSGKSNIADSIRWVLGEQSYSLLRGKKTIDMIFSGSESKSRAGMASATITFNNESNWLPIDFSEVAITRRAYRDGQNEYLINNQKVRLKDVSELLGNSGLSERTYTVIGQGLVDAALALKAEERRKLFEEAAGIGLYRSRRDEAYRRLDTTKRNLTRVDDILSELRPRLRSLEKQAERTRKYEQIKDDLQILLREWYGFHWFRAQEKLEEAVKNLESRKVSLSQISEEHERVETLLLEHRSRIQELRSQLNSWHHQISNLHRQREEISVNLAVTDERIRSNQLSQQNIETQVARLENERSIYQGRFEENNRQRNSAQETLSEIEKELASSEARLKSYEDAREQISQQISQLQNQLTEAQNRISESTLESEERRRTKSSNLEEITELDNRVSGLIAERDQTRAELDELKSLAQNTDEKKSTVLEKIDKKKRDTNTLEQSQKETSGSIQEVENQLSRIEALIQAIENAEASMVGYAEGVKRLLERSAKEPGFGQLLPLIQKMEIPQQIEIAVTAALGEFKDAMLFEDNRRIDLYLDDLSGHGTRGTLLPVSGVRPPRPVEPPSGVPGVLGVASDLVRVPPEYRLAVDVLLNNVIVVRDRRTAKEVLKSAGNTVRVVTLNGEVFHARGLIQAGVGAEAAAVRRPREKQELLEQESSLGKRKVSLEGELDQTNADLQRNTAELSQLETQLAIILDDARGQTGRINELDLNLTDLQRNIRFYQDQIDKLRNENQNIDEKITDLQRTKDECVQQVEITREEINTVQSQIGADRRDEIQQEIHHWRTQKALFEEKINGIARRIGEAQSRLDEIQNDLDGYLQRKEDLLTSQERMQTELVDLRERETALLQQVEEYQNKIDPAEAELLELEERLAEIQMREDVTRQGLNQADRMTGQAQLEYTRRQEAIESMRERIEDDLGLVEFDYSESVSGPTPLPFEGIVEHLPQIDVLPAGLEQEVKRQKAQLRRTGPINPDADKEYKEVKERHDFMLSQIEDLENAERDIRQVIAELDKLMERDFLRTFEAVAEEFEDIFKRLFGGGSAKLVLVDPEDLTETGIDIEARLPGRRSQGLSLLSGGERSLTATSLVFALLKVSPTPFCVLDEVDAMLDEANVGRFRELLKELSQNTQFIIITHNRNTVQAADVIYGITMSKESTSQVISLKMDQYEEILVESA